MRPEVARGGREAAKQLLGRKTAKKLPKIWPNYSVVVFNSQFYNIQVIYKWKNNWKFDQNSSQTTITITVQSVQSLCRFVRFISSLLLLLLSSNKKRKRGGALPYVIKPFLYCDLFKASARAKRKEKNVFVRFRWTDSIIKAYKL